MKKNLNPETDLPDLRAYLKATGHSGPEHAAGYTYPEGNGSGFSDDHRLHLTKRDLEKMVSIPLTPAVK